MAWPLLLFLLLPVAIGCVLRVRYPAAEGAERSLQIISLTCLLLYANVFIVSNLHGFASAWGSGTYAAAVAVPILGIVLGSLISRKTVGARRASVITTAQRSIGGAIVVTIFNYPPGHPLRCRQSRGRFQRPVGHWPRVRPQTTGDRDRQQGDEAAGVSHSFLTD